jgi:glycogen debranching enzyme
MSANPSEADEPRSADPLPAQPAASQGRVAARLHALKDGDTFVVADAFGDIYGDGDGMFHNDTRILSELRLTLAGAAPSLLSAAISRDNVFFAAHLTNRPLPLLGGRSIPEGVIHIERARFLANERLYEHIEFMNYGDQENLVPLGLHFAADFRDMFEVRGQSRSTRGKLWPGLVEGNRVIYRYEGLDGILRAMVISFSQPPSRLSVSRADFMVTLPPNQRRALFLCIGTQPDVIAADRRSFRQAASQARRSMRARMRRGCRPHTSARLYNEWLQKSQADLAMLTSDLPTGPYPYAGIPWFSAAFGRDAIVTALQTLWLDASIARGVLRFLAQHQATETSAFQDAAPGKIIHETRKGEMTATRELPFGRYYGGVDTTPLFVMLATAYADRTGDLKLINELWPALLAAVSWLEMAADAHPHGFVGYARAARTGLANQGWKDSEDSIFHADGRYPVGPIALVEVQGFAYAALAGMAQLAERRGEAMAAMRWRMRADALRAEIEQRFWMPNANYYGIAEDGEGALCRVRASNAGLLLFVGLSKRERALAVASQLLSAPFNSGWGIRTLAEGEAHYNPMSYHNGSVWPHDTALCAAGLARYGERDGVVRIADEVFEAAVHFGMRLPELFCGFRRIAGEAPIAYPVACLPQAWAAGSAFMLLQACLGVAIDGWDGQVRIEHPRLPTGIDRLTVANLPVGEARITLHFHRVDQRVVAYSDQSAGGPVSVLVHV